MIILGYREVAIQALGGECHVCHHKEDLAILEEEQPKVICKNCAAELGINTVDNICNAHMTRNNQVTIGTQVRCNLNIEPGDSVYFQVIKVISPNGEIKYGGN